MTDLRIWSTLTSAEQAQAIETAKGIIASGETRWHVVARLCGIKGGIPLRTALDEGWRAKKREKDRKRSEEHTRAGINRAPEPEAYVPATITLPKLKFMEESTWREV